MVSHNEIQITLLLCMCLSGKIHVDIYASDMYKLIKLSLIIQQSLVLLFSSNLAW